MVVAIYSTTGNIEEAKKIARVLVEEKLVACVNIIPKIDSIYRWKNKIEEDSECIIIAKTIDGNLNQVVQKINKLHSYDLPDIIAIPIVGGLEKYLEYIEEETK
jgi:periplasmic divalent cation tolerance protein